jgi:hypothetical protein
MIVVSSLTSCNPLDQIVSLEGIDTLITMSMKHLDDPILQSLIQSLTLIIGNYRFPIVHGQHTEVSSSPLAIGPGLSRLRTQSESSVSSYSVRSSNLSSKREHINRSAKLPHVSSCQSSMSNLVDIDNSHNHSHNHNHSQKNADETTQSHAYPGINFAWNVFSEILK